MGITSGPHGLKRLFVTQLCPDSVLRASSVEACLADLGSAYDRGRTAVVRDASVLLVGQVPGHVRSLDEYVEHIESAIVASLRSAQFVWLCIDDLAKVPQEKAKTQQARQSKLLDVPGTPVDDNYSVDDIYMVEDCHVLVRNRKTRYRFIDEVLIRVFQRLNAAATDELHSLLQNGTVVIDSIDERGASRDPQCARRTTCLCTRFGEEVARALLVRGYKDAPWGEADLKLRVAEEVVAQLCKWGVFRLSLILVDTIDTDQIPICLLHAAERRDLEVASKRAIARGTLPPSTQEVAPPVVALLMRERGKWAADELVEYRKRIGAPVFGSAASKDDAGVLLLDIDGCHRTLERLAYSCNIDRRRQVTWTRLLVGAWALSGCDFVDPSGRCDHLTAAFWQVAARYPRLSIANGAAFMREVLECAQSLAECSGGRPKRLESAQAEARLRTALWASSYWSLCERDMGRSLYPVCA